MNTVTGFIAIVSLLLALAAGGGTTKPQPQAGATCPPWEFGCGSGVDGESTDDKH